MSIKDVKWTVARTSKSGCYLTIQGYTDGPVDFLSQDSANGRDWWILDGSGEIWVSFASWNIIQDLT
jgi:hypothetical protein